MKRKGIGFKGMVRATAPQIPGEGSMEELINLRVEYGALRPVGKKMSLMKGTSFGKVIKHEGVGFENYIAFTYPTVKWVSRVNNGTVLQTIYTCSSGRVYISTIGDMLVINCIDEQTMVVYKFNGTSYTLFFNGLPPAIKTTVTKTDFTEYSTWIKIDTMPTDQTVLKELITSLVQEVRQKDRTKTEGYILVSANYTLFDGSETKMSPPHAVYLGDFDSTPLAVSDGVTHFRAAFKVSSAKIGIQRPANPATYRDLIKSINIYVSSPISKFDLDYKTVGLSFPLEGAFSATYTTVGRREITEETFENVLFYKQHSFSLEDNADEYDLRFDVIETGRTMPVDSSGWLKTVGKPFVYNKRLHLFDYKRTLQKENVIFELMSSSEVSMPTTTSAPPDPTTTNNDPPPIMAYEYYGFGTTRQAAYSNGAPSFPSLGFIYAMPDGTYKTASVGGDYVPQGYYVIYPGGTWDNADSTYIYVNLYGYGTIIHGDAATTSIPTTTTPPPDPDTLDYLAYDPDYTTDPYVVSITVSDWGAASLHLYSVAGINEWYMDDEMATHATGLFVANYSTTQYVWYEIINGIVMNQGLGYKSGSTTTESPATTSSGTTGEEITTNPPTTQSSTTQPSTTESSSTTAEALQNYEYYGYSSASALAAWESGSPGDIYLDTIISRFYKLQDGSQLADDGYYITEWAETFEGCSWMMLVSGYMVETN